MIDTGRRELIKSIVKGGVYASPVIATLAAPSRLMGQGPSGMMMPMWCDYFPILCRIFGDQSAAQGMGRSLPLNQQGPVGPPPPGSQLPPGSIAPPGGPPPFE